MYKQVTAFSGMVSVTELVDHMVFSGWVDHMVFSGWARLHASAVQSTMKTVSQFIMTHSPTTDVKNILLTKDGGTTHFIKPSLALIPGHAMTVLSFLLTLNTVSFKPEAQAV